MKRTKSKTRKLTQFLTLILPCLCSIIFCCKTFAADTAKPWTFWYWMYGEVSEAGIEADLQAMKDANIAGFYLMPIKGKNDIPKNERGIPLYKGDAEQLSPTWWKMIDKVYSTSEKLGLEMGIHISDGFALAGGPWIKPDESMKRVVYSDTVATVGKTMTISPYAGNTYGFYRDIAILAYPARFSDARKPKSSVEFPFKASEPADVVMEYDAPYTLRSVKIVTGGNNIQAHRWAIYASNDGKDYKKVCDIEPARQGWQNTDAQATYSTPATTARFFKFHWDPKGSNPGAEDMDAAKWKPSLKIADLILSSEPVIDGYEGKSGVAWRVSKEKHDFNTESIQQSEIINLTEYFDNGVLHIKNIKDKKLQKQLKNGKLWHIVRIGYASTGHSNATGGGGKGPESDKFNKQIVRKQFDNWFARIYNHVPKATAKKVLTRLHVDSWECGSQNWSENFADEFQKRRGYDLNQWLLLYAGVPVESVGKSDAVLRDIRTTIGELISDVFFTVAKDCAQEYGVQLSTECVAPTMVSDGLQHYKYADIPMGEFWLNSPTHDKPNDMLDAVSGAHIYGKNIIQAEGFTEVRGTWDEHPAMLKPLLDRNFCVGINSIVFHVMTHNPYLDKKPGMTLDGIGTFFQRDNTWWKEMAEVNKYIYRCQKLLQYGKPVVDIAAYIGDEMPRRSIIPNRLTNSLSGLFGQENIKQEQERLANKGLPMEVSPVGVNHTKNMVKADDFTNPLHGYRYDSFNHDVLNTAKVVNGKIHTAYGMEYSALLVPQTRPMNPNNINTATDIIEKLKAEGAIIIDKPWAKSTLDELDIPQDIVLPEGIDYTHRTGNDKDIYFLSNQSKNAITLNIDELKPRAKRAYTYIYDAVNDKTYKEIENLTLNYGESRFLILSDEVDNNAITLPTTYNEIADITASDWNILFETTGKNIKTAELKDWTTYDEPEIKYYSGHATYSTEFKIKPAIRKKKSQVNKATQAERTYIVLENVNNIATVIVNGVNCGTVWTAPYKVDITNAVNKGVNKVEISVVNTWANALLGNDLGTPPFPNIWTNGKYRRAEKTTIPAGITGNIKIISEK